MKTSKSLYRGFSYSNFIWYLLLRIAVLVGVGSGLLHFDENPVVISIFLLICVLLFLFLGDDQIDVYSDRVVHYNNSLAHLLSLDKPTVYSIKDIRKASLPDTSVGVTGTVVALLLAAVLPKQSGQNSYPIFLELKNGKTVRVQTYLRAHHMKKVVELVNSLV